MRGSSAADRFWRCVRRRLPVVAWGPRYRIKEHLPQDFIAGITVGLTMVGQSIAYASIAGVTPEYGLHSALLSGLVYLLLGNTSEVSIGPTAIMSALLAPYVADYSAPFAVFAAFVTGAVVLAMALFRLSLLVEFISGPVIAAFTLVGALQIATSQVKGFFGLSGSSGNYVYESVVNAINNARSVSLWDPLLGVCTLGMLYALQWLGRGCGRGDPVLRRLRWFVSLSRNTVVIVIGMCVAYLARQLTGADPFVLTGDIAGGLPRLAVPPLTLTVDNETLTFFDMVSGLGVGNLMLPLIAMLEAVALAKAFTVGKSLDATQEMIAVGCCNLVGSFVGSIPVTASFTRAALSRASGVCSPLAGLFTGLVILLTISLLTSTFYYIPKSTLSALIIAAMVSMMDVSPARRMWASRRRELLPYVATVLVSAFVGLEYGIVTGVTLDAVLLLYGAARPAVAAVVARPDLLVVALPATSPYCAADHIRRELHAAVRSPARHVAVDGAALVSMDSTVATNLAGAVRDLQNENKVVKFVNFKPQHRHLIAAHAADTDTSALFVAAADTDTSALFVAAADTGADSGKSPV